jgi:XrtJ-associated TM-motif-TM protein
MKNLMLWIFCGTVIFASTHSLYAQGGCVSSPENPTAILALVGSAGAFIASARTRIKARNSSKK